MDGTYSSEAHANGQLKGCDDKDAERRQRDDRRHGADRRKHERRHGEGLTEAYLTPEEIAALLNGSR